MMVICHWCGEEFEPTAAAQIYCSRGHSDKQRKHRRKLLDQPIIPCPHPEKMVFFVRGVAIHQAKEITEVRGRKMYYYLCQCGAFHHTKNYHPDQ